MKRILNRAISRAGGEAQRICLREVKPSPGTDVALGEGWGLKESWSEAEHPEWAQGVIPLIMEITGW